MTEKTRVRLGAYFLFGLLVLTLPVTLVVSRYETISKTPRWRAGADGMEFVNKADRARAVASAQKLYGVSRPTAERLLERRERETGLHVGKGQTVPYGATVDYYTVDGSQVPNTAKYEGAATVTRPSSAAGQDYISYVREQARKNRQPQYVQTLEAMLKKGFLLIPASWGLTPSGPATDIGKAAVKANTTNLRIAVICTILPGFRDISPRGDGDTNPNDTGHQTSTDTSSPRAIGIDYNSRAQFPEYTPVEVCYRQAPWVPQEAIPPLDRDGTYPATGLLYNYADYLDEPAAGGQGGGTDEPYHLVHVTTPIQYDDGYWGSIFDSPGGVFTTGTSWGIPVGINGSGLAAWDYVQAQQQPNAIHATNNLLQNDMYELFFNQAFTAQSCSNWFYQQTHGAVKITGTTNDIAGWLHSNHQLNRYPYQIGSGNNEFIFPGTPVIRTGKWGTDDPVSNAAYDPAALTLIRASLSAHGLTLLFSQPVSQPTVAINMYTNSDTNAAVSGTQPGMVDVQINANSSYYWRMDPYDARRWTLVNPSDSGWKYLLATSPVTYPSTVTKTGEAWSLPTLRAAASNGFAGTVDVLPVGGAGEWDNVSNPENQGCPSLQNTTIGTADLRVALYSHTQLDSDAKGYPLWDQTSDTSKAFGQVPFARLKSLWYYTHSYNGSTTRQVAHLRNEWDYADDIAGTTVSSTAIRPKPFDTGPNDAANGGYWPTGAANVTGGREGSSSEYAGDVNNVLRDNGISLTGYQYKVYIEANGGSSQPGDTEGASGGGLLTFQPSSSLQNINESGTGVVFHELAHAITQVGATDLYDNDLYANGLSVPPPNPTYHECAAMNRYSIMDAGGRLDAWHLAGKLATWGLSPVQALTQDTLGVSFPEVESMLRDPVIVKMPANPYYIKQYLQDPVNNGPDTWEEYFLLENRNQNNTSGNGAYGFDTSAKGLYIYHIDERSPARNNPNQAGFQRDDDLLTVIIEQADGLHELEFNNKGNGGATNTDPFGADTASRVTRFWQFPVLNGDTNDSGAASVVAFAGGSPTSESHGYTFNELAGGGATTQAIASTPIGAVRSGNVVTITTTLSNTVKAGDPVVISGVPDSSFNGAFNVASVVNATAFTFAQTDDDATSGGGSVSYAGTRTNIIIPGTETDSFSRIVKISARGTAMTADCYVEPAELIPTLTNSAASLVTKLTANIQSIARSAPAGAGNVNTVTVTTTAPHGFNCGESVAIAGTGNGTINGVYPIQADPATPNQFTFTQTNQAVLNLGAVGTAQSGVVQQGEQNIGFLKLVLQNPDGRNGAGLADYTKMSIKDVYMEKLYVLNSGTGTSPADVALAKLFVDSNGNGRFEPATDTLLTTATLETAAPYAKHAIFGKSTDLGYRIPLGDTKTFFVAYDLAAEAQINPHITVGAEFTDSQKLEPRLPGTVQVRQRNNNPYDFGISNFPIFSQTATIVGYPDRLVLTGDTTNLPAKASQGQLDVPVLRLTAAVNPNNSPRSSGSVRMDSIRVDQVGSMDAVSDLVNCKLYLDNGDGAFDASVDGAYTMATLGLPAVPTSSFTPVTPVTVPASQRANYPNLNLTVNAGTPRVMFLACSIATTADPDNDLQLQLSFDPEAAQPQTNCYVQLINNTSEDNSNKDYVWYDPDPLVTTDWPIKNTVAVDIITPNTAPTPPVAPFSPSGGQQISNQLPTLSWGAGADADAGDTPDTLHYEVQIADNSSFTSPTTKITAEDTTTWPLTTALNLNQQYWWRARTIDRQDAPSAWCTTQTFTVVSNRAPVPIAGGFQVDGVALTPGTTLNITTTTPTLTWNKTTDQDTAPANPDTTLRYLLQIDDNSDFSSPVTLTNVGGAAPQWASFGPCPDTAVGGDKNAALSNADQNTYTLLAGDGLTKATTYYWRVAAVDNANAECDWTTVSLSFKPTDNHAPNTPVAPFQYSGGVEVTSANPVLSWAMPATPDPDPTDTLATIPYNVRLKLGDGDLSSGTVLAKTTNPDVRQWAVGTTLTDNGHYFWQVRAVDDEKLRSSWTAVQDFWVNIANDKPNPPTSGWDLPNMATTSDTTPTLSWDNSVDPDPDPYDDAFTTGAAPTLTTGVSWVVQLSQSSVFSTVAYTYTTGPLAAAGRPSVTATTPLTDGTRWYWRVAAIDNDGAQSDWSNTLWFTVDTTGNAPTAPTSGFVPPTGTSISAATSPTLQWNAGTDTEDAATALRYEVQVADSNTFGTASTYYYAPAPTAPGVTSLTLPAAQPLTVGQTYYWHVRTMDSTLLRSPWSTTLSFTVVDNRPPNAITTGFYPAGTLSVSDTTPDLRWNAATPPDPDADDTGATIKYLVQLDDDSNFSSPVFATTVNPPHADATVPTVNVTTALTVGVRYYWRVRPEDQKGLQATAWSATQDFRVVTNQAPVAPAGGFDPSNGEEVTTPTPHIQWNAGTDPNPSDTAGTLSYQIQVKDDADLASGPYAFTKTTAAGENWADVTTALQDNTHYYYRVRTLDAMGLSSAWTSSAATHFYVNTANDAPTPPTSGWDLPNTTTTSDTTPTLSWDNSVDPDADPYDGAYTTGAAPTQTVGVTWVVELSQSSVFSTVAYTYTTGPLAAAGRPSVTPPVPLTDKTRWYWRVAAVDNDGAQSAWSSKLWFMVDTEATAPTAPTSGFVPPSGSTVGATTGITLAWDAGADNEDTVDLLRYEVEVADTNTFATAPGYYYAGGPTAAGVQTVTLPSAPPLTEGQTYFWHVRTRDTANMRSPWSVTQSFTVGANRAPNAPTSGFWPAGNLGISDKTPTMLWDAATDPDANDTAARLRYNVEVDDNSDFSSPVFVGTTAYGDATIDCTPAGGLAEGATYYWRVRTQDAGGLLSGWSAQQVFRIIANRAPATPIAAFGPVSWPPINTANPTLTWNMPATPDPDPNDPIDTIKYEVQLDDQADLANGPYVFTAITAENVLESICSVNLTDNQQYWWRVRSIDRQGLASDWSEVQTFWVNLVNQAPLPPDAGFDPSNGMQVSDSTPDMSWYVGTDADPDDTANTLHYVVEFATSADFATVAYQYTTADGVTNLTPPVALTDRTRWYWRVRTVDNSGATSAWSEVQDFYLDVNNQMPTLSVSDTPTYHVDPLYGGTSTYYQLYVTYTDAENDQPGWVRCTFANGVGPLEMRKVIAGDNDATNGILYVVGVAGTTLGLGAHEHAFTCEAGVRLPAVTTSFLRGPVIGVASTTRFLNTANQDVDQYEEGSRIRVEVYDLDQNADPAAIDTLSVTITEQAGDTETFVLRESAVASGRFRGSIATLGATGTSGDGVLNAIGGAAGNAIRVTYTDPDDLIAPVNPTPDSSFDTATVVDTTAPDIVGGGVAPAAVSGALDLTSGVHGRTVAMDWATYAEAQQVDVAGYHVWVGTSQFTSTAGLTSVQTVPAGTRTFTATQLPSGVALQPNTTYWFAVSAFDEVPLENQTVESRSITTRDTSAPVISAQNPAPGTTEVALNSTITFNLNDQGVGIDQSTLAVTLRQNGQVIAHNMPLTTTGDDAALQVTVTPTVPLLWNATVNVEVDVKDHDNNQLLVTNWEFDTVTDHVVPTLDERSPAADATNVPVTTNISFSLHDTGSGINGPATVFTFNGTPIPVASLQFTALSDGWRVTYDPPADLSYNTQYNVTAQGFDVAGNTTGEVAWSFNTVVDSGSVAVDQFDPARGATNVPIATNVSFRMSDPLAGIVESSFRLWVNSTEVTGTPEVTVVKVPAASDHPNTMAVSYNPPADFAYATDIPVRIYAEDRVGNVTDLSYSFRTVPAPTYNISGTITTSTGTALAGVTVTAGGKTTQSDGNGAYRITGLLAGDYTVTPTRDQYVFAPTNAPVTLGPDDAVTDFVGTLQTYALSGRITEAGEALAGVTVACNGLTARTDANGDYRIEGLPNGQYTVTPTLTNFHFQPATRAAEVAGANVTGVNFEAVADTFTVQGTITDNTGSRVEGARVECGGKAAITNAAGQYLISGLRAGTYTVTPTKSGYQMDPLSQDTTVPPSKTAVDFTANIEMVSTFPSGVNLIGVPGVPLDTNPMNAFGVRPLQGEGVYRWNPAAIPPRYYVGQNEPTAEPLQVKAGRGFFVKFNGARELHVAGKPTSATGTTSIGLGEGWNMIANPRATPLKFSSFVPNIAGGIRNYAFVYDNAAGTYLVVSSDASVGATRDTILGWEGAWVRATGGGVSLLVSGVATAATPQAMRPQQADLNGGWMIPLVASAGGRKDVSSVAGLVPGSAGAHTIENPPTAPDTVDVFFTTAEGDRLAHDVRSSSGTQTFTFVVACEVPDADVTVTLPDMSTVPADQQIMLLDKETGKSQYARTMTGYTYHSTGARSERVFELTVSPRTVGALSVSATAAQARGGNVTLSYTVTKACAVSVKVMNMAGRCIRELVTEKPVTAGVQGELWNLCAASGTRVPSGMYFLQIEALTEDGQRVSTMAQVRVTR